MQCITLVVIIGSLATISLADFVDPESRVKPTIGGVWPKPKYRSESHDYHIIDPRNFKIVAIDNTCDILDQAIDRYMEIIFNARNSPIHHLYQTEAPDSNAKLIDTLRVNLTSHCEQKPHLKMDEWYYLSTSGVIISHSIWGVLRALETFSQMVTPYENGMLRIDNTHIRDEPRFCHRGLLVDTSRHFIDKDILLKILDGMAYNKLNVFHWHIVDDESFPYESKKFPELSEKGAYTPSMVYTQKDVADIIEYARIRGIRVIPEFDVPAHSRSWGISHPELLTSCEGENEGHMGPMNPILNSTYTFVADLLREVQEVYPDQYIHLGGDEVGFECWSSNQEIIDYMKKKNIAPFSELLRNFMERVTRSVTDLDHIPIVWQEAMVEKVNMPPGTVVQLWRSNWRSLALTFTGQGHRVLISHGWYLDNLSTEGDFDHFYACDPQDFVGTDDQKKLVIGGEACMWSEHVDNNNILQRIFPRASATAERLWSDKTTVQNYDVEQRLEEHIYRMNLRGIPVQPANGPGFVRI